MKARGLGERGNRKEGKINIQEARTKERRQKKKPCAHITCESQVKKKETKASPNILKLET